MSINHLERVSALKQLVIRHGLPREDYALFGIKCPYCGKMDRICLLEPPEKLTPAMGPEDTLSYKECWNTVSLPDNSLGVCKFCHNLLKMDETMKAAPLVA